MKRLRSLLAAVFAAAALLVLVAALAATGVIATGWYNVAATEPHLEMTRAILATVTKRSVGVRARDIRAPDLSTPDLVRAGAAHYAENCALCHGAPGREPDELAKGLTPPPPDLAKAARDWSPPELYWIVKHGIRMTGMPAWGPTHSDDELWAIVAFLVRLPRMSAQEYGALTEGAKERHHH